MTNTAYSKKEFEQQKAEFIAKYRTHGPLYLCNFIRVHELKNQFTEILKDVIHDKCDGESTLDFYLNCELEPNSVRKSKRLDFLLVEVNYPEIK